MHLCITRPQWVNSEAPVWCGNFHFNCDFQMNCENWFLEPIWMKVALKSMQRDPIMDNWPTLIGNDLVPSGNKPLSKQSCWPRSVMSYDAKLLWRNINVFLFHLILLHSNGTSTLNPFQWKSRTVSYIVTTFYGIYCKSTAKQCSLEYSDSKLHGANMGPIWGQQDPGGPHVGPMNFAIWVCCATLTSYWQALFCVCAQPIRGNITL